MEDLQDIPVDQIDNVSMSSIQPVLSEEQTGAEEETELDKYRSACQNGDLDTVKELIETGVIQIDKDFDETEKVTGLHWASVNNRLSIVEYLVGKGADVNRKAGNLNATSLHWAASYGYVYIVDFLLQNGADPAITDDQGFNVLHLAVNSSNIMLILYVLYFVVDKNLIDINCVDPNNRTPLLWAAYQGDSLTVNALLRLGAKSSIADSSGFTALHWGTVKGQPHVLKYLMKDGADFFAKTNDGKNCFKISEEMNTVYSFRETLNYCGLGNDGYPIKKLFRKSFHAKLATFFIPWLLLGVAFAAFTHTHPLFALVVSILFILAANKFLKSYVLPCYNNRSIQNQTLLKSPVLAGVFMGSVFWLTFVSLFAVFPNVVIDKPVEVVLLLITIITLCYLFMILLRGDPGVINAEKDSKKIRTTIKELMDIGKFDTKTFCIETLVRKPLRSKYSYLNFGLVTRFDHYCPWVFNDVGLKNHKMFIFFISVMIFGIWLFAILCFEYFDEVEDMYDDVTCAILSDSDLCAAFHYSRFTLLVMIWSLFQSVWVGILIFVQLFQVFKGTTSYEFSKIMKQNGGKGNTQSTSTEIFNTTPDDHPFKAATSTNETLEAANGESDQTSVLTSGTPRRSRKICSLCFAVLGLEQWITIMKETFGLLPRKPRNAAFIQTNYGWRTNFKDFWLTSDLTAPSWQRFFFPPTTLTALLNNVEVDYSKLYEYPEPDAEV